MGQADLITNMFTICISKSVAKVVAREIELASKLKILLLLVHGMYNE